MEPGLYLTKLATDDEDPDAKEAPHRELVGSVLWTSLICHPEISFAVGQVAKFNANPWKLHWEAAKRILRYLKGKKDMALLLGGCPEHAFDLAAYSDADWAGDWDDWRSISGYVVKLGNSSVSWSSKKQPTVATSLTEAKYVAALYCTRTVVWICHLLSELDATFGPSKLFLDNQGSIDLTKDPWHSQRTWHIDVAHH
jgi:hypothetical protein